MTPNRSHFCLALLVCSGLAGGPPACAGAHVEREYAIKAAFLCHFARYVQWPEGVSKDPFIIGVLGNDPFGALLDDLAAARAIGGSRLVVRRFRRQEDYTPCHILFVSGSEAERLEAALEKVKGSPVLTVGDTRGLARRGVAVNFLIERNKIRFEINPAAAKRAGLKISSKLLRLARSVREGGDDH